MAIAAIVLVVYALCPANHEHSAHAPHEVVVINLVPPTALPVGASYDGKDVARYHEEAYRRAARFAQAA